MFYTPVSQDLGVSLGTFVRYLTLQGLVSVVAAPLLGKLSQKINLRYLMIGATVIYGISWLIPYLSQEMWHWYLIGILRGMSMPMFFLFISVVIQNWFETKTGMALGIATACTGFSGAVINYGLTYMIGGTGWRLACAVCGILLLALLLLVLIVGVRVEPAELSLEPYGMGQGEKKIFQESSELSFRGMLSCRNFWLLAIIVSTFSIGSVIAQYAASYVQFRGGTLHLAGLCTTATLLGNSIGKIILGALSDRLGAKRANRILMLFALASFLIFLTGSIQAIVLCIACFTIGFHNSMISMASPSLTRLCFTKKDYSRVYSWLMACQSLANALGVSLLGSLVDWTGSYVPAFLAGLTGGAICLFAFHLLFRNLSNPIEGENNGTITSENRERNRGRTACRQSGGQSV